METCIEYTNHDRAYFSSDEPKYARLIEKLKAEYPDEVNIIKRAEENDGCIYASLPVKWFKLRPPRKVTDEMRERGKRLSEARLNNGSSENDQEVSE